MEIDRLKEILGIEGDEQNEKIEAAIAAINEETDGLVKTKDKLRTQVKDLDKRLKSFKDIDLEEIEGMKTELAELREAAEADDGEGNTRKISAEERKAIEERATKKLNDLLEAERSTRQTFEQKYQTSLKETALRKALKSINVIPEDEDLIYDAFVNKAKVDEIDGNTVIQLTNKDGLDLPPDEFFADWAKTDSAKRHITPPDNSGGGARGGNASGNGAKTITRADWDNLDPAARQEFAKNKGQVTDE